MNKKLPLILLILIIPFILTACTLQDIPLVGGMFGGKSSSPVTLNIWGLWESPEVLKALADKYILDHNNVTVNYDDRSVLKPADYKERVVSRLSTEGAQDILIIHNSWVKELSPLLSAVPTNVYNPTDYASNFYPVATQSATVNNELFAIPAFYDGLVLVYNKDHFKEIDQLEAPTSWEEFRKIAIALTVKGTDDKLVRAGAAIGGSNNIDFAPDILGLLLSQAGVTLPDDLDSRSAQDALLFYTDFVKEYHVWDASFIEASAAFAEEKVSMIFVPTWNLLDILAAKPGLNIGVAAVPQAISSNPVSWGSFWMYAVPANSSNKAAAWEFIKFLVQTDQQKMIYEGAAKYRQYGAPYALTSMSSDLTSNPYVGPALKTAPFAKSGIIAARAGNALQEKAIRDAINTLVNVKDDKTSAATVLKTAKTIISAQKAQ